MTTAVPQYHEKRLRLSEMDAMFQEFIGGPAVVDVGETLRVMLGDYFYGEALTTNQPHFTMEDRTIVFPYGVNEAPFDAKTMADCADLMGEIFWAMNDTITTTLLQVTPDYTHKPSECLYKFFPATRELVVYTPVLQGLVSPVVLAPLDGRAVITACHDFLPSWLKAAVQQQ
ncbi:hypothetical protein [Ralstonia phage RP31]|uniref:Uncharacterized protein n=1 Tax=Ralstonia phage RP31 TaxID=1923890 RepID=A0A1L7N1B2_9CAUD|nr:hypothetical protein [Ralstonia phage RP31]